MYPSDRHSSCVMHIVRGIMICKTSTNAKGVFIYCYSLLRVYYTHIKGVFIYVFDGCLSDKYNIKSTMRMCSSENYNAMGNRCLFG